MSFKRRFEGSNDEQEMPPMPEKMAKAFEEAFKPEPYHTSPCRKCLAKTNVQCETIQILGHCRAIGVITK